MVSGVAIQKRVDQGGAPQTSGGWTVGARGGETAAVYIMDVAAAKNCEN